MDTGTEPWWTGLPGESGLHQWKHSIRKQWPPVKDAIKGIAEGRRGWQGGDNIQGRQLEAAPCLLYLEFKMTALLHLFLCLSNKISTNYKMTTLLGRISRRTYCNLASAFH